MLDFVRFVRGHECLHGLQDDDQRTAANVARRLRSRGLIARSLATRWRGWCRTLITQLDETELGESSKPSADFVDG